VSTTGSGLGPGRAAESDAYLERRGWIARHFQESAERWSRITSDAPVGRIRATVREGRNEMRAILLDWLPADLEGRRILDAGCGPGGLSLELARRGARVVGVDLSPALVERARERVAGEPGLAARIEFRAGDMLSTALGPFDHVVAMDSLIHYPPDQILSALSHLARRVRGSLLFTVAPRTPLLVAMHALGGLFPRSHRSPSVHPVGDADLRRRVAGDPALAGWELARRHRVHAGFYISEARELRPTDPPRTLGAWEDPGTAPGPEAGRGNGGRP